MNDLFATLHKGCLNIILSKHQIIFEIKKIQFQDYLGKRFFLFTKKMIWL